MNIDKEKINNIADEIFNIVKQEDYNEKVFFSFYSEVINRETQEIKKRYSYFSYSKEFFIMRKYGSKHGKILKIYKYFLTPYEIEYLIQKLKSCKYTPLLVPISFVNRKINYHVKSCSNCINEYEVKKDFKKRVNNEAKNLTKSYQNQIKDYESKLLNIEYKANDVLSMYEDLIHNDDNEVCYAKVSLGMTKDILYQLGLLDENGEIISLVK